MAGSIKKNYFYNLIYQLTAILLPLITMPYIARVLQEDGVGINSYTNANTQYFILLGSLGVSMYATKKIAMLREKKEKLKKCFWEIFLIQFIGCLLAYLLFIFTLGADKELGKFYFLQGFFILSSAIDISWYFLGVENFKNASLRSFFVKIISVILIFIFVKTKNDLGKYIFINSSTMLVGQIIMWFYIDKSILNVKNKFKLNLKVHLLPILALFIPQIATQVYTVLDKTMIGLLADTTQVGFYDQSQKIIRVLLAIVTSLGMVMLPRIANLYSKKEYDTIKQTLKKAFILVTFLAVPMTFGIMAVSQRFIPMFFGIRYISVIPLLTFSSVMIVVIGLGNIFGTQYLIAVGKTSEYTKSVCVGAVVNFILNILLIPKYLAMGAVIATVVAETSIAIIQLWYAREIIDLSWLKSTYKYWFAGIIMFIIVKLSGEGNYRNSILLFKQVIIGFGVYFVMLLILRDKYLFEIVREFKSKILKK